MKINNNTKEKTGHHHIKNNNHKPINAENAATGNTTTTTTTSSSSSYRGSRIYRTTGSSSNNNKWSTREIAALDFLLGIPLEAERSIVKAGVEGESRSAGNLDKPEILFEDILERSRNANARIEAEEDDGDVYSMSSRGKIEEDQRWWEKLIMKEKKKTRVGLELEELERPSQELEEDEESYNNLANTKRIKKEGRLNTTPTMATLVAPGRRLEGRDAVVVTMPKTVIQSKRPTTELAKTRQRSVTYLAAVREWELRVAHGVGKANHNSLLDGRVFFSSRGSYPAGVFSVIKYEPKKEEAARRRKKLEELGGGGTQFVMPQRDWRGISYYSLLSHRNKTPKAFNRYNNTPKSEQIQSSSSDDESISSSSSDESDTYHAGFLDDPMIVQGKHRHVMIGDRNTGPILSSTILFVKPQQLKKELNKQFRERFDGWEPPKPNRKYIGARVIDGAYTLHDPTDAIPTNTNDASINAEEENASHLLRMPPSLTLSKIRNIKEQALYAGVKADLEISTVALACVYFERLALDCRVDKSNRRLAFAACLLLASKINESDVAIVHNHNDSTNTTATQQTRETKSKYFLPAILRQTNKGNNMFASLLEFFTHDWSLSLKHIFAAEWGVFVALGFDLNATPTQISFHFKRLMKELERNPLPYLGHEMYTQWQQCLQDDSIRRERHEKRKEKRRRLKERKLLQLQRNLQLIQERKQEETRRSSSSTKRSSMSSNISDNHSRRNSYLLNKASLDAAMSSTTSKNNSYEDHISLDDITTADASHSTTTKLDSPTKAFPVTDGSTLSNTTPSSITNQSKSVSHFLTDKPTTALDHNKSLPPSSITSNPRLSTTTTTSSKKLWNRIMTTKRPPEPISSVIMNQEDGSICSEKQGTSNNNSFLRSLSSPNISSMK